VIETDDSYVPVERSVWRGDPRAIHTHRCGERQRCKRRP